MQVVIGLGASGIAAVRYLRSQGFSVLAMDSADEPKGIDGCRDEFPDVDFVLGSLDPSRIAGADQLIVSPGVPLQQPLFAAARQQKIPIVGDIELFARATNKPIYAVTGSNGKTTVTTLLGLMAEEAGAGFAVAGNIGQPVLDLLVDDHYQGFILELSSFQLESTFSLNAAAAVLLNVTPDHLDRHQDFSAYCAAKQRIYHNCQTAIVNFDAPELWPEQKKRLHFSIESTQAEYFLAENKLKHGATPLLSVDELPLQGAHHYQNALAALAMGEAMGLPQEAMLTVLKRFKGLPHRCQHVRTQRGVAWYNDSKATNVGAAKTAIQSLAELTAGRLFLIAGGQAKNADFSELKECVEQQVSEVILLGEDKQRLFDAFHTVTRVECVADLSSAIQLASQRAKPGDCVLLSPACASFDMFQNFEERGECFIKQVEAL